MLLKYFIIDFGSDWRIFWGGLWSFCRPSFSSVMTLWIIVIQEGGKNAGKVNQTDNPGTGSLKPCLWPKTDTECQVWAQRLG